MWAEHVIERVWSSKYSEASAMSGACDIFHLIMHLYQQYLCLVHFLSACHYDVQVQDATDIFYALKPQTFMGHIYLLTF